MMGKGRVESFSDGVMAVAITLLAFNLHAGVRSKVALVTQITEQWPSFAAYVLSFFIIGVIWLNHHYLFQLTNTIDRRLMLYNLLLLLFVVTIPYATATYADYALEGGADARTAVLLYAIVMEGMAISRFLIPFHILRAGLNHVPIPQGDARKLLLSYSVAVLIFPVITAISLLTSAPMMLVLHALVVAYYLGPGMRPIESNH
jgi:uncharacterized membrane protein